MRRCLLFLCLTLLTGCGSAKAEPVIIFAAASSRQAMEQIAADFKTETGIDVQINSGASSTLAKQIDKGAAADLFLSADESWADFLADADRDLVEERRDLLTNQLVLVVPAESKLEVKELKDVAGPDIRRLALAGAQVPAGAYARQALKKAGVWDRVKDRILEGGDVKAALTYVARGEADAGFVYKTDARGNDSVRVALEVPAGLHDPIRYPLVLVRRSAIKAHARRFYEYLGTEAAERVFREAGFGIVP
jgi:molybdate transport system substrate-binding protein